MNESVLKERVFTEAERIMMAGVQPTLSVVAEALGCETGEISAFHHEWWQKVPDRIRGGEYGLSSEMPVSLTQSFLRIWQEALQEASSHVVEVQHDSEAGLEIAKREADQSIQQARRQQLDLEDKYRKLQTDHEEAKSLTKALEAEIEVLKSNLANENAQKKSEEKLRHKAEQDLNHLRKTHDDAKRTFDQRIKDEQRHALDAVSKADADIRYYRGALEKLRDEVGKKESALTKNIHDLQAEVARKEVKSDTFRNQIKKLEDELKQLKQNTSGQNRDLSKVNSQLLSESNKNKRLADRVQELEEEIRQARQKAISHANEQTRRENGVRAQYKQKEEELVRALGRVTDLEKKITTQDEEIRRLNRNL